MLKFFYSLAPNPMKVALFLEETGIEYEPIPVDTRKGEQLTPEFTAVNPNQKVPVIQDGDQIVFDSNAILLFLAEKHGQFLPADKAGLYSWLMFVATGIGPYSGQCVHFRHFAPDPKEYAVKRYVFEARRHWEIIDRHLEGRDWMVGDAYSIVDMAVWGWARMVPFVLGAGMTDETVWTFFPNLKRLMDAIGARPATARANALKDRHAFKTEVDDEARRAMFRHAAA